MIIRDFNNGWGSDVELRKFELDILRRYLDSWYRDDYKNVIINSTWYSEEYHAGVLEYLLKNPVDKVALVSFVDPAIPKPSWFYQVNAEICCVGYYPGPDEIDVWALIMDRYFGDINWVTSHENLDRAFLCYNRKPHPHRMRLVRQLAQHSCLDAGVVTLGNESGIAALTIEPDIGPSLIAPNAGKEQYGIVNDIMSLGPPDVWNRCFLNIVTETVFDVDTHWFVSEKIYKPVLGLRPFLVYAPNGARNWLHHVGIEDFVGDFVDITDLDLSEPSNIAPFLRILSDQGPTYWRDKYCYLNDKIISNRQFFLRHVESTNTRIQQRYDCT